MSLFLSAPPVVFWGYCPLFLTGSLESTGAGVRRPNAAGWVGGGLVVGVRAAWMGAEMDLGRRMGRGLVGERYGSSSSIGLRIRFPSIFGFCGSFFCFLVPVVLRNPKKRIMTTI